jgi:hypothetical protein
MRQKAMDFFDVMMAEDKVKAAKAKADLDTAHDFEKLIESNLSMRARKALHIQEIDKYGILDNPHNQRPQDIRRSYLGPRPCCIYCGTTKHWSVHCQFVWNLTEAQKRECIHHYKIKCGGRQICRVCLRPGHRAELCLANTLCPRCNTSRHCRIFHVTPIDKRGTVEARTNQAEFKRAQDSTRLTNFVEEPPNYQ